MNISHHTLLEAVRPTTIIESPRLSKRLGIKLTIASETFQYTGSFKFRAAYNVVSSVSNSKILAASAGNFGQAIAYACGLLKKSAIVVMPATAAKNKIDAVLEYGGAVDLVDLKLKSRAQRVSELALEYPEAYVASPYDDPLVIEGNASLGDEILALSTDFDCIVVPVGGGGLASGIVTSLQKTNKKTQVVGAEPLLANDAAQSLRAGKIVSLATEPQTIADGARTISLGKHNWEILKTGLSTVVEVSENHIEEAVRLLFSLANLKTEPTGALSVAALLTQPELFRDRSVCCVVSGGNVDLEVYQRMLSG